MKMEKNSQKNVSKVSKCVRESSKKKGPSNYYFWVAHKVKNSYSLYIDQQILDHFLRDYRIAYPGKDHFVECLPCKPSDHQACHIAKLSNDKEPTFFFVYDVFFSTLGFKLPFSSFEVECLDFINVALTQLHPNSWVFIQAFEILMEFLCAVPYWNFIFFVSSQGC